MYPRSTKYENSPPLRTNIITVAMPGITSSRSQLSRYTADEGITVLENWSSYEPLREVDGGLNRHTGNTALGTLWEAVKAIFKPKDTIFSEDTRPADKNDDDDDDEHERARMRRLSAAALKADAGEIDPPILLHSRCRIAPRLLHNIMPSPEVSEMVHNHFPLNPIHLALVIKEMLTCLWFTVRPIHLSYSELGRTNLAGLRDQAYFTREVRRAVHHIKTEESNGHDKKKLVLFGCSRGAATCFQSAMKLPMQLASYVSLVVLEAPFDTLEHVIRSSSISPSFNMWLFKAFCDYRGKLDEQEAYSYDPAQVNIRCPVAFIISVKDRRVPNECTQVLIDGLRERLVPHVIPAVEVLVLKHSRHPCMPVGHKEDQDAYVAFMERLYNTYC